MRYFIYSSAGTTQPTSHSTTRFVPSTDRLLPTVPYFPHSDLPRPDTRDTYLNPSCQSHSFFNVHNDSLMLSSHTKDSITQAIHAGWAESTLKCYTGTIKQFIHFCDAERVPEHLRFPTDEFVLCAFAASSVKKHAGGTPQN